MNARELALDVLLETEKNDTFAGTLVRGALEKYDYEDPRQKAFFKCLVETVLEHGYSIDWALNEISRTPTARMKPLIRALLRLSAAQILYLESVPDRAACDEAVKLAKRKGFGSLSGYVNGVLRNLSRNKERIRWPDPALEPLKSLSVRYSLPEWLLLLWREQYGERTLEERLPGIVAQRPLTIRFRGARRENGNLRTLPRAEAETLAAIRGMGVSVTPHPLFAGAYTLENVPGVAALPGFAQGQFYVQDVSSMLAVAAAGIGPGMRILDLCASPGGKAILAAEYAGKTGRVLAGDVSGEKVRRIRENAVRMGCKTIETRVWDARVFHPQLEEWADVVLADVPCSGFGVLSRKKEIRYRIRRTDLNDLTRIQRQILSVSRRYVRPGGILLYSTCTMDRLENEEMLACLKETGKQAEKERPRLEVESLDDFLPQALRSKRTGEGMLQLWPGEYGTDGFFMARLRRSY